MKPLHDAIYIVTATEARAEAIKQIIALRDFDEILTVPYDEAIPVFKNNPPALVVSDLEGDAARLSQLMSQMPPAVKSLVLSNAFDEDLFVTCYDHGARDFLVQPVPDAYLVSRVLQALQECRVERTLNQKDRILVELGVLSARSGVFSTQYFLKLLKQESEHLSSTGADTLSLVMVQLGGYQSPLPEEVQNALYSEVAAIIKECIRGFDEVGEYFMDKFAVLLPHTGMPGAQSLAERLQTRLDGYLFKCPAGQLVLRVRVGLANYVGCQHYEELINRTLDDLKNARSGSAPSA